MPRARSWPRCTWRSAAGLRSWAFRSRPATAVAVAAGRSSRAPWTSCATAARGRSSCTASRRTKRCATSPCATACGSPLRAARARAISRCPRQRRNRSTASGCRTSRGPRWRSCGATRRSRGCCGGSTRCKQSRALSLCRHLRSLEWRRAFLEDRAQLLAEFGGVGVAVHRDRVLHRGVEKLAFGVSRDRDGAVHLARKLATIDEDSCHGRLLLVEVAVRLIGNAAPVGLQQRAAVGDLVHGEQRIERYVRLHADAPAADLHGRVRGGSYVGTQAAKLLEERLVLEHHQLAERLVADTGAGADAPHLHEGFLAGHVLDQHAAAQATDKQDDVDLRGVEHPVAHGLGDLFLDLRLRRVEVLERRVLHLAQRLTLLLGLLGGHF